MEPRKFNELKPKVVLGIAAHPDDLDFGASGSMARWARDGAKCYYVLCTDGSKGSDDPNLTSADLIRIRKDEQEKAAKILGLEKVFYLDHEDGLLENTIELKRQLVRIIREVKPDVMVTMDPSTLYMPEQGYINHPDHRAASQAALDAIFPLSRDRLSFPELAAAGYAAHKTPTVLLMSFGRGSNFWVDISETLEQKLAALKAHDSQGAGSEETQAMVASWTAQAGQEHGKMKHAEGFIRLDVDAR